MGSVIVDIFASFVIIISVISALRKGLILTLYNFISMIIILLATLHLYPGVTDMIKVRLSILPEGFGDFLAVGVLFTSFMIIARLLRELLTFFLAFGEPATLERFVSVIFGFMTGVLSASMFIFWVYLAPWSIMEKYVDSARISKHLYILPATIYTITTDYLILPYINKAFMPNKLVYLSKGSKKK